MPSGTSLTIATFVAPELTRSGEFVYAQFTYELCENKWKIWRRELSGADSANSLAEKELLMELEGDQYRLLPGGFAPYVLAPINNIVALPTDENQFPVMAGALVEPFAAALQAVDGTGVKHGARVAVLGTRRLGLLVVAALRAYRSSHFPSSPSAFHITGLSRHLHLLHLSEQMGADASVSVAHGIPSDLLESFDLVFDTTASPDGLLDAARLVKKGGVVHLKTTNGREVAGVKYLTAAVVDEIAVVPWIPPTYGGPAKAGEMNGVHTTEPDVTTNAPCYSDPLQFTWSLELDAVAGNSFRTNPTVYCSPTVPSSVVELIRNTGRSVFQLPLDEAWKIVDPNQEGGKKLMDAGSKYPRFDIAVVTRAQEIDEVVRPQGPTKEVALIRPRGAILVLPPSSANTATSTPSPIVSLPELLHSHFFHLHTSRCGSFPRAVSLLSQNGGDVAKRVLQMVTDVVPLRNITTAMEKAAGRDDGVVKVVVECSVHG
ncbi:hypothetical protein HDU93_004999 [Gonapodya sp. JEL0774]|nr:hypothetical protein HDU93_004999 [Gonapodya sp. JEL0774]